MILRPWLLLTAATLLVSGAAQAQDDTVTLVTHDSFAVSEAVLQQFTAQTGLNVEILRVGDAGLMVNQAVLSAGNPLGDVLFGVDNTFLSRALDGDIFQPYASPLLESIPADFQLDAGDNRVTPIDYGDVCLNYDIAWFEQSGLPLPQSLADLAAPEYSGLLAVPSPATSSPGLAFLLATVAVFGDEGDADGESYLDYWRALAENDVRITEGWTDAYYGAFSGSAGSDGDRPLVVSYASSPPAEVVFAEDPAAPAPTGAVIAPDTCFRQIEFAGILRGASNEAGAQQLIDFMLSVDFQQDMPLNMFVFPVNPEAELPEVFAEYAAIPDQPIALAPAEIETNRDRWIQRWVEVVLRS